MSECLHAARLVEDVIYTFTNSVMTLCFLLSAADLGELLQRPYGHQDPGRLHGGEADGAGPHHRGRPRPDLQR